MTGSIAPMEALPTSFAQELLFLLDRAAPGLTAYNVSKMRRVRGDLDFAALQQAFDALVSRHEILRTTYGFDGDRPVQLVGPSRSVPLRIVDLTARPGAEREGEAMQLARESTRTPFDLATDVLLRATLFRLTPDEALLLLETHHIVSDGWSSDIMFRELAHAYDAFRQGLTPEFPALPIQYADFAVWQREQLAGVHLDALLGYWRTALGDADMPLNIPTDFPRTGHQRFVGAQESIALTVDETAAVKTLAQQHDATLYMAVLSAYQAVLHRWTGQQDVLVGSPIAGRALPETHGLIGYFANTLVLRGRFVPGLTFSGLLRQVRDTALDAYDHQDVPLEKLVMELRDGQERLNPAPLFQVVLTMLDTANAPLALPGVTLEPVSFQSGATKFDFTLFMADRVDGLRLTLSYRADLFRPDTAHRFLGHLRQLLVAATVAPGTALAALPMLTPEDVASLDAWNATKVDEGAPATVLDLFDRQTTQTPDAVAIRTGAGGASEAVLTRAELNQQANRMAHSLQQLGVRHGDPVGLLLEPGRDAIIAILAILKAGGAYVPLSVDAPAARLAQQLGECRAAVVVTESRFAPLLPSSIQTVQVDRDAEALQLLPADNPARLATPDSLAYVLFTSGSTGTPKGVAVTHANIVHYTRAICRAFTGIPSTQAGDGFAGCAGWQFGLGSTLAADLGNTSLYPALLAGGSLNILDRDATTNPAAFGAAVRAHPLDVLKLTPNHLMALTAGASGAALAELLPRQWLVLGGEALHLSVAHTLLGAAAGRLLNHYGPTETTVGASTFEITTESLATAEGLGAQTVPLGRPLANTTLVVRGPDSREQPVGLPGELMIGGAGVTRGYLGRPELTAERFVALAGERMYATGDRVRRLVDGSIEFLGRFDDQVKIRGHRVELSEISHMLLQHPGVATAVAVLRPVDGLEPHLIAYVVPKQGGYAVSHSDRPTSSGLIEWIAAQLPPALVPSAIVMIDQLPLTPNGKVDQSRLPAPGSQSEPRIRVAPATTTEESLLAIWADALKREAASISTNDDFIALGGHSLLAIRILGKISRSFGVRLPLRTLFDAPRIDQLAEVLDLERKLKALDELEANPGATNASPDQPTR